MPKDIIRKDATLFFEGPPIPKGRPRYCQRGGRVFAYTPKKTQEAEVSIREKAKVDLYPLSEAPFEGRICVDLAFRMPIPKSLRKKVSAGDPHVKRPDLDNLIKLVIDALTGVAWKDDAMICIMSAEKTYSHDPMTIVNITYEKDNL